ncbi:MAG: hypothetical protein P1U56_03795 [Saprospiraceae bacterium]|nr:hypothetical protein [Saprospiraceae bacterium]
MMRLNLLLICICFILFSSCNNESIDSNVFDDNEIMLREGNLRDTKDCFRLKFPIEITLPDQSSLTANNEEDLRDQLKSWYALNPDIKERPSLNYPVIVIFEGDKSKRIKSSEQMMRLRKYCKEKAGKERKVCFRMVFPLNYLMPDGTTITIDNEEGSKSQIKEWYANNPDAEEKPELVYPVDVKVKGGQVITINDEDQMIQLKKRCSQSDKDSEELDCPKLEANIGDDCRNGKGELGVVTEDCKCS